MARQNFFLNALLCSLALAGLVSCGQSKTPGAEDTLDKIRRTGQIDACVVVYPPEVMKDAKTGALSGICIDTIKTIAEKMNAKVVFHESTWGNATADLASGRCDVMASFYDSLIPRAMAVAFTQPPIEYVGLSALVRTSDRRFKKVKDVFEFDRPDITVSVPTGEVGNVFVKENFKKAKIKPIDVESSDLNRFCVEVSTGRADVAIADMNEIALYAKAHPEVTDLFGTRQFYLAPASWAVRQTDFKWLHFLETALEFLNTQGTLPQIQKKYHAHFLRLDKQYKLQ